MPEQEATTPDTKPEAPALSMDDVKTAAAEAAAAAVAAAPQGMSDADVQKAVQEASRNAVATTRQEIANSISGAKPEQTVDPELIDLVKNPKEYLGRFANEIASNVITKVTGQVEETKAAEREMGLALGKSNQERPDIFQTPAKADIFRTKYTEAIDANPEGSAEDTIKEALRLTDLQLEALGVKTKEEALAEFSAVSSAGGSPGAGNPQEGAGQTQEEADRESQDERLKDWAAARNGRLPY